MPRHLGARVRTPPEETAVSVALEVLNAVAEDPYMRGSYRQQARRYLNKIRRAEERATRGTDDDEEA